jgi:4,5-DOPA dioxygenase extradiol
MASRSIFDPDVPAGAYGSSSPGPGAAEAPEHPHRVGALGGRAALRVRAGRATPLVYDFGGFHPRCYTMTYDTPDAGDLARRGGRHHAGRRAGLPFVTRDMLEGAVPAWSSDFDAWASDALARGDVDELAAYASRAPGMPYAHPTADHYVPLSVALGAADRPDLPVETTIEGYLMGFSKRSFQTIDG